MLDPGIESGTGPLTPGTPDLEGRTGWVVITLNLLTMIMMVTEIDIDITIDVSVLTDSQEDRQTDRQTVKAL